MWEPLSVASRSWGPAGCLEAVQPVLGLRESWLPRLSDVHSRAGMSSLDGKRVKFGRHRASWVQQQGQRPPGTCPEVCRLAGSPRR